MCLLHEVKIKEAPWFAIMVQLLFSRSICCKKKYVPLLRMPKPINHGFPFMDFFTKRNPLNLKKIYITWGAAIPPILAIIEHIPMAVLLTTVGYSSAVYKYTIENDPAAPNFPERTEHFLAVKKWLIFRPKKQLPSSASMVFAAPSSINPAGIAAIPVNNKELTKIGLRPQWSMTRIQKI